MDSFTVQIRLQRKSQGDLTCTNTGVTFARLDILESYCDSSPLYTELNLNCCVLLNVPQILDYKITSYLI